MNRQDLMPSRRCDLLAAGERELVEQATPLLEGLVGNGASPAAIFREPREHIPVATDLIETAFLLGNVVID